MRVGLWDRTVARISAGRRPVGSVGVVVAATLLTGLAVAVTPSAATTGGGIAATALSQVGAGPCTNGGYDDGLGQLNSCYGQAWCADFAGWVWAQNTVGGLALLGNLANSFQAYADTFDGGLSVVPHTGDAVFFHPDSFGGPDWDHVAIVTAVHSDGTIDYVGGNQSGGLVSRVADRPGTVGSRQWTAGGHSVRLRGYARPAGLATAADTDSTATAATSAADGRGDG